jgi:hypothetical protein
LWGFSLDNGLETVKGMIKAISLAIFLFGLAAFCAFPQQSTTFQASGMNGPQIATSISQANIRDPHVLNPIYLTLTQEGMLSGEATSSIINHFHDQEDRNLAAISEILAKNPQLSMNGAQFLSTEVGVIGTAPDTTGTPQQINWEEKRSRYRSLFLGRLQQLQTPSLQPQAVQLPQMRGPQIIIGIPPGGLNKTGDSAIDAASRQFDADAGTRRVATGGSSTFVPTGAMRANWQQQDDAQAKALLDQIVQILALHPNLQMNKQEYLNREIRKFGSPPPGNPGDDAHLGYSSKLIKFRRLFLQAIS